MMRSGGFIGGCVERGLTPGLVAEGDSGLIWRPNSGRLGTGHES